MKVLKLSLAAAILSSGLAFAEETKKATEENTTTTTVKPITANLSEVGESEANREGKRFTINAGLVGIQFSALSSSIEGGYHLSPNSILTLQYTSLNGASSSDTDSKGSEDEADEVWEDAGKGRSISAGLKHFVGNSFYVKPEVYHRRQDIVHSTTSVYSSAQDKWLLSDKDVASIEDLGASFKIGNQWQWDNFTLGCDWVGYSQSITTLEESGNVKSSDLGNLSLVNFYLGATF